MTSSPVNWCSHITHRESDKEGWYFGAYYLIRDDWDTCPVKGCGAKRPEPPSEREVLFKIFGKYWGAVELVDAILARFELRKS